MKTKIYYYNEEKGILAEAIQGRSRFPLDQIVAFHGWSWTREEAIEAARGRVVSSVAANREVFAKLSETLENINSMK